MSATLFDGVCHMLLLLLSCVRSYTIPGKRNTLLLHCSLQRATGRMLVHTVEVNNSANDHVSIQLTWGHGQPLSSAASGCSRHRNQHCLPEATHGCVMSVNIL